MLTAITTALLTFLFTGIVANRLVQRWQYRNWVLQQRLIDAQDKFKTIQSLFNELSGLSSRRHNRMRLLLASLRNGETQKIQKRLSEYDDVLIEWNERLNPLSAQLTLHLRWYFTHRLQDDLQPDFLSLGQLLEHLARLKLAGAGLEASSLIAAQGMIDRLQGKLFNFNRDILKYLVDEKAKLYDERALSSATLDSFPTWELFKALFQPRVHR